MLPSLWRGKTQNWSPFRDLESIQEEVNRLFNVSLGRSSGGDGAAVESMWMPAIDVVDNKNDVRVLAEIPGLNKEDIHVSVEGDTLTIKGEKKQETKTNEAGAVRTERTYGTFYRELTLPQVVDAEKIKAQYKNGVLELTLPKKEEAKPKQINVSVN